jgi:hypothetical protein
LSSNFLFEMSNVHEIERIATIDDDYLWRLRWIGSLMKDHKTKVNILEWKLPGEVVTCLAGWLRWMSNSRGMASDWVWAKPPGVGNFRQSRRNTFGCNLQYIVVNFICQATKWNEKNGKQSVIIFSISPEVTDSLSLLFVQLLSEWEGHFRSLWTTQDNGM